MYRINEIQRLNEAELQNGIEVGHGSWHDEYNDSAWIFIGGLSYDLTEGDILQIFSQFGPSSKTIKDILCFLFFISILIDMVKLKS